MNSCKITPQNTTYYRTYEVSSSERCNLIQSIGSKYKAVKELFLLSLHYM